MPVDNRGFVGTKILSQLQPKAVYYMHEFVKGGSVELQLGAERHL